MRRRLITDRSWIRSAPPLLGRKPLSEFHRQDREGVIRHQHTGSSTTLVTCAIKALLLDILPIGGQLMLRYVGSRVVGWRTHWYVANPGWPAGWAEDLLRGSWILVRAERGANPIAATASNTISTPLLDPVGPVKAGSQHPVEPLPLLRLCHPLS